VPLVDVGGLFDLSGDDGTAGTLEVLLDDFAPQP
jgi:hypothetical protein